MSLKQVVGLYAIGCGADFASSLGGLETNPFARTEEGVFWPAHALLNLGYTTFGIACFSGAAYLAGRLLDKRWGVFCASLPWLYYGWMHFEAAIFNSQLLAGLAR